jgi:hypothetical protein
VFHSLVFFFGAALLFNSNSQLATGSPGDQVMFGDYMMAAAVVTVTLKAAIEIKYAVPLLLFFLFFFSQSLLRVDLTLLPKSYWTFFHAAALVFSVLSYIITLGAEGLFVAAQEGVLSMRKEESTRVRRFSLFLLRSLPGRVQLLVLHHDMSRLLPAARYHLQDRPPHLRASRLADSAGSLMLLRS